MYNITAVCEEVNVVNYIKLATFRVLWLNCSATRTLTTGNTYRSLGWSYDFFSGKATWYGLHDHDLKLLTQAYCFQLIKKNYYKLKAIFLTRVLNYSSVTKYSSSSPGARKFRGVGTKTPDFCRLKSGQGNGCWIIVLEGLVLISPPKSSHDYR